MTLRKIRFCHIMCYAKLYVYWLRTEMLKKFIYDKDTVGTENRVFLDNE